jgi:hypothetical protein
MTIQGQTENIETCESERIDLLTNGSNAAPAKKGARGGTLVGRSTGPRTRQGKDTSKKNALKYGIFSQVVVLKSESQAEFDALQDGLCDYFQPVGTFEEGLVETLAVTRWRQRRLLIAEAAEIEAGREFIEWDERQRQLVDTGRIRQVYINGGLVRKIANPEALQRCLDLLKKLRDSIEQDDFDPQNDAPILTTLYGEFNDKHWEETLFNSYLLFSRVADLPDHIRKEGEFDSPEEYKKAFLEELADEQKRLERYKKERSSIESSRVKLEALRRNVPDSPRLDHLLRYAASLERSFDRTLNQLERAQRMRLGQPVLPPINVNISS